MPHHVQLDARLMDEWIEIVKDVSLVLAGAIGTYLVAVQLERRAKKRRAREVAVLLADDIIGQLGLLIHFHREIAGLADTDVEVELESLDALADLANFYSGDMYLSLVPELSLLPLKCVFEVSSYHTIAERYCKQFNRFMESKDRMRALPYTRGLAKEVVKVGGEALYHLSLARGLKEEKARALTRKVVGLRERKSRIVSMSLEERSRQGTKIDECVDREKKKG